MANWKKMAEAFGRAMSGVHVPNDAKNPTQTLVRDVNRAQANRDFEQLIADSKRPERPVLDAYYKGQEDLDWQPEFDRYQDYNPASEHREAVIDAMTDRDLQKDFTDLFEAAAAKAPPELRIRAIEMLQRGESIPDVLDVLNWGD